MPSEVALCCLAPFLKKIGKLIEKWMIYQPGCSGRGCCRPQRSLHQNGLACRSSIFHFPINFQFFFRNGFRQHQVTSHCIPRKKSKTFITLLIKYIDKSNYIYLENLIQILSHTFMAILTNIICLIT